MTERIEIITVLSREEWKAIGRDYKGITNGMRSAFAGALPKGKTTETGTTLVAVRIETNDERKTRLATGPCEHAALVDGGGNPMAAVSRDPTRPVCAWCGEPFTHAEHMAAIARRRA